MDIRLSEEVIVHDRYRWEEVWVHVHFRMLAFPSPLVGLFINGSDVRKVLHGSVECSESLVSFGREMRNLS